MFKGTYSKTIYLIIGAVFLLMLWVIFFTDAGYSDGDSITHYFFAHYSFQYPHLFLDHWGKPLFTLLASPFAQFGFKGIQLFNVICGLTTAYFTYLIAVKLELKNPIVVSIFLFLMPAYFLDMPTGLTELLFTVFLTFGILLILNDHPVWAGIVLSFIPMIRNESVLMFPLFTVAFILLKKYKAIPFLVTGILIYSIVGWLSGKDFLWLYTEMGYKDTSAIYGNYGFLLYAERYKGIFGIPLTFATALGILAGIPMLWSLKRACATKQGIVFLWLVYGCFAVHFLAHSFFGLYGAIPMSRIVVCILPLAAIIALRGTEFFLSAIKLRPRFYVLFFLPLVFWASLLAKGVFLYSIRLDPAQRTVKEACQWLKSNGYSNRKIFNTHPLVEFLLGLDPYTWDDGHSIDIPERESQGRDIPAGGIVVWDSQFGNIESQFPKSNLEQAEYFRFVKAFSPSEPIEFQGRPFEVNIYERK